MTMDSNKDSTKPEQMDFASWRKWIQEFGEKNGFYRQLGEQHDALFVEGNDTLVVTFENLDHVYSNEADRLPWGYDFITKNGWAMLGLMAHDWTWYRDNAVYDFFDELRDRGFFAGFERVVFYGASMGGYAACAFSASSPGATVVAISPQATLDQKLTPWEQRYKKARSRNFRTRYGYAPDMVQTAEKVFIYYDPQSELDSIHAIMFNGTNIQRMKCRFFGHRIASLWTRLGILKPIVLSSIEGNLTQEKFYPMLRGRREEHRYQREMLGRLTKMERDGLIVIYCQAILARRGAPKFRRALNAARQRLKQ